MSKQRKQRSRAGKPKLRTEAERLWEPPEMAPDVPPAYILHQFLHTPQQLDAELVQQIQESPTCLQACEELKAEEQLLTSKAIRPPASSEVFRKYFEQIRRIPQTQPQRRQKLVVAPTTFLRVSPAAGQIWATTSEVEHLMGLRLHRRWTFTPLPVLITGGPEDSDYGDTRFSVVPCTSKEVWDFEGQSPDEQSFAIADCGEYVAHLWLHCKMSASQLAHCFGVVNQTDSSRLEQLISRFPVRESLEGTKAQGLERERLSARAIYLVANAEARRLRAGKISAIASAIKIHSTVLAAATDAPAPFAARGHRQKLLRGLFWDKPIKTLSAKHSIPKESIFFAERIEPLQPSPDNPKLAVGQWQLPMDRAKYLRGGETFFLLCITSGRIVGTGIIERDKRTATLNNGRWDEFETLTENDLILVIPEVK